MNIITKKCITVPPVTVDSNYFLENVDSVTILGVKFTSDLRWNAHILSAIKKASRNLYIIYNLFRSGSPVHVTLCAYYAYVRSVLLYGYPCFFNAPLYLLKKISSVERRVIRLLKSEPAENILDCANATCKRLFLSIQNHPTHPLRIMFEKRSCQRATRTDTSLRPPRAKTKRYSASFISIARWLFFILLSTYTFLWTVHRVLYASESNREYYYYYYQHL